MAHNLIVSLYLDKKGIMCMPSNQSISTKRDNSQANTSQDGFYQNSFSFQSSLPSLHVDIEGDSDEECSVGLLESSTSGAILLDLLEELPETRDASDDIRALLGRSSSSPKESRRHLRRFSCLTAIFSKLDYNEENGESSAAAISTEDDSSMSSSCSSTLSSDRIDDSNASIEMDALNFPFDLLEGDFFIDKEMEGCTEQGLFDEVTNTSVSEPNSCCDSSAQSGSQVLVDNEMPNMEKLDECMRRTAESRSMVLKLIIPFLPSSLWEKSAYTVDDASSTVVTSAMADETFSSSVNHKMKPAYVERQNSRTLSFSKTRSARLARKRNYSKFKFQDQAGGRGDYTCSGVLIRSAPPSLRRNGLFSLLSAKSQHGLTSLKNPVLLDDTDDERPRGSISSFLRQRKKQYW